MALNKYGWNKDMLKIQFNRAMQLGWLSYMKEFSVRYDIPVQRILAIASRETNMKNIRGDWSKRPNESKPRYHGYGPMQVDINTNLAFTIRWEKAVDKNAIVREAIEEGVKILKGKYRYLANKGLRGFNLDRHALAAYNGGEGRVYKIFLEGKNPDNVTTKKNYSDDILAREKIFLEFLATI